MRAIAVKAVSLSKLVNKIMKYGFFIIFSVICILWLNAEPQWNFLSLNTIKHPIYIKYQSSNESGQKNEDKDWKFRPDTVVEFVDTGAGRQVMHVTRENVSESDLRPKEYVYVVEDGKLAYYPDNGKKLYIDNSVDKLEDPFFWTYLTNLPVGMDPRKWPRLSMFFQGKDFQETMKTVDLSADGQMIEIKSPVKRNPFGECYGVMSVKLTRIEDVPYPSELIYREVYLNSAQNEFPAPYTIKVEYSDYKKLKRSPLCIPQSIEIMTYVVTPSLNDSDNPVFSQKFNYKETVKISEISEDAGVI